jgi:hypothetical protein
LNPLEIFTSDATFKKSKQNTSWCVLQYFFNKFYDATKVTTIHKKVCPNMWVIETPQKITPFFIFYFTF